MGDRQNENAETNDCEREQGADTHQLAGETDRQKPRQDRDNRAGDQRRDIGRAGTVTLPTRARNKSAGMLGSSRSDDFAPRLHRRGPEGSVRSC